MPNEQKHYNTKAEMQLQKKMESKFETISRFLVNIMLTLMNNYTDEVKCKKYGKMVMITCH